MPIVSGNVMRSLPIIDIKKKGIEATEKIRAELPLEDQPIIIALTADAFKENAANCIAVGMNCVITKP